MSLYQLNEVTIVIVECTKRTRDAVDVYSSSSERVTGE
jgi:hypothetical protein